MLAAGLEGIEQNLQPPEPVTESVFSMSSKDREALGIGMLPESLHDALALTEKSDLVRHALGEHVFDSFIQNKRIEWESFRSHVTDFEIKRYMQTL